MQVKKLEAWYEKNHQSFSFRETDDPYKIWVSEIMLQQTQIDTVLPYFERFIKVYPDVYALSKTAEEQLKKVVEGIGYYRRFMHMLKAAKMIVDRFDGVFPTRYEDVLSLPGIGLYTAGAIMSIAYHKPYSAVDGNVIRILSRQYNIEEDMRLEKHKNMIRKLNQELIEHAHPNQYTQALMDLGRTICKPKNPLCEQCPVADSCLAYELNTQAYLPYMTKLKKAKVIHYVVLIIHVKDGIILRKRNESLLQGMYEYPQFESESIHYVVDMLDDLHIALDVTSEEQIIKHVFTHQKWIMHVYHCQLVGHITDPSWQIYQEQDIEKLPMAIAHKKIRR